MRFAMILTLPLALAGGSLSANTADSSPDIDYGGFAELTIALNEVRSQRLLDREAFFALASDERTLLLDTRSAAAFKAGHIEGAVNLPFSDFTEASLSEVIGEDSDRPILIYCNNNFSDNVAPVISKKAPLALNIPTFINLHGYGYTNVWELGGIMSVSEVPWVSDIWDDPKEG